MTRPTAHRAGGAEVTRLLFGEIEIVKLVEMRGGWRCAVGRSWFAPSIGLFVEPLLMSMSSLIATIGWSGHIAQTEAFQHETAGPDLINMTLQRNSGAGETFPVRRGLSAGYQGGA